MPTATMAAIDQLEPTARRFVEDLAAQGAPPINSLPPADARQVLENLQSQPVEKLPADIQDINLPAGPTGQIPVRIVRPPNSTGLLPAVMYFHGGGWILGSKNTHDRLVREIANGSNAAVVFVDYTRSPEVKYPVALEEAYAATHYIAEHGARMNIDGSRLAVVGDSVGGNMAAVVCIMAKQRGRPKIAFQVLCYPVTDAGMDTPSYKHFASGFWLSKPAMRWFWDAYAPDPDSRKQITISPARASIDELVGLPPALVITDENDVLRDEGEAYAHMLMQAGVDVTAVRYLGTLHDFMVLNPLAGTPATRGAVALANLTLRRVLAGERESTHERQNI